MSIVNKRNPLVGWVALKLGKRVVRGKVRVVKSRLTTPRDRRPRRGLAR